MRAQSANRAGTILQFHVLQSIHKNTDHWNDSTHRACHFVLQRLLCKPSGVSLLFDLYQHAEGKTGQTQKCNPFSFFFSFQFNIQDSSSQFWPRTASYIHLTDKTSCTRYIKQNHSKYRGLHGPRVQHFTFIHWVWSKFKAVCRFSCSQTKAFIHLCQR